MKHFVYIIYSKSADIFYRGYTANPQKRLIQHNLNESKYTANKGPWSLVFLQSFLSKKEALIRERKLKKYSKAQVRDLMQSTSNECN